MIRPLLLLGLLAPVLRATDFIEIPAPDRSREPYARTPGDYPDNPLAVRRDWVPAGELIEVPWNDSAIFPGTTRRFWIHVPARYDGTTPAALMVFLDGHSFVREDRPLRAPAVLDNLIAAGAMPVTIGVFVDPGQRPPLADEGPAPPNPNLPLNRRFEYDSIDDRNVRFLDDEVLAYVRKHYRLSADPADHAIVGNSSGGIGAFVAAWHRPDLFGKVAVHNGTFVDLLGGDVVPTWVREQAAKPLRVSLTSGPYDLSNAYGVWWDANRTMAAALRERGYDVRTVWGDNPHNPRLAGSLLGETLAWLWRDHPAVDPAAAARLPHAPRIEIPAPPRPETYATQPPAYWRLPDDYPRPPVATPGSGIPRGRVERFTFDASHIYPGTTRPVWVYVPAQYDGGTPAALMVFQDGELFVREDGPYHVPAIFDRLIAAGEMPVTIGVFVEPGEVAPERRVLPAPIGPRSRQPGNRRDEYDNIDERYGRFLLEELLPRALAGLNVSTDPAMRALVGNSSGGSAAFNAAWHRPEVFGKVVSHIGSFTAIRGAHHYPQIVRESAPRPLRIVLQSGVNDQVSLFGDWWQANRDLAAELRAQHADLLTWWGDGGHTPRHSAARFPDTLRWLWRDWR